MFETVVVVGLVTLAALWSLRRLVRTARGTGRGCSGLETGCSAAAPKCYGSASCSPLVTITPLRPRHRPSEKESGS